MPTRQPSPVRRRSQLNPAVVLTDCCCLAIVHAMATWLCIAGQRNEHTILFRYRGAQMVVDALFSVVNYDRDVHNQRLWPQSRQE